MATASLELGIDIGTVDLVCQIGSPRSIAVAWQRIGRSGHWHGAIPKGRIFATTRSELIECAALVRAMRRGELDRINIPENSLDILAQQIVATCASEDWSEDDLFALVRRAYPYRNLERSEFDEVIVMLSEGINARRGRYGAYLHRDRVNGRVHARRGSRLAAITSGGAIPDNALYTVVAEPEGAHVGTVDEDFAVESLRGDIMLLGNSSWRIRRVRRAVSLWKMRMARLPTFLFGAEKPRRERANFRSKSPSCGRKFADMTEGIVYRPPLRDFEAAAPAFRWLEDECGLDRSGAEQAVEYIVAGRSVLGAVPTQSTIIAERFFDESGGMQLVIHAPFGGRINKAWGLALRKRFCRSFNLELQAAATDEGINIRSRISTAFRSLMFFVFCIRLVGKCSSRRSLPRRFSPRAGAGMHRARLRCCAFKAEESASANSTHAGRRFAGRGISRCRGVPGKHRRRDEDSGSSADSRSDEGRADGSDGSRRTEGPAAANSGWTHSLPGRRYARALAVLARNSERESVCLSGRCAARGTPRARRRNAPRAPRNRRSRISAAWTTRRSRKSAEMRGPTCAMPRNFMTLWKR